MYWDVVEVKPEPDYRLFVRFRDGLTGHIHLERKNMTGVLSPLADPSFFEQVFIDSGAVAWPGEIDLAPDAMYATVANQKPAPRLFNRAFIKDRELKNKTTGLLQIGEPGWGSPYHLRKASYVELEAVLARLEPDAKQ